MDEFFEIVKDVCAVVGLFVIVGVLALAIVAGASL